MSNLSPTPLPVAITMGDPSGVGAEVIVKALAQYDEPTRKRIIVVGDRVVLDRASKVCGVSVSFHDWKKPGKVGSTALCQITVPDLPDDCRHPVPGFQLHQHRDYFHSVPQQLSLAAPWSACKATAVQFRPRQSNRKSAPPPPPP